MIPFRTDNIIRNDVEYLPTVNKNESLSYYGLEDAEGSQDSEKSYTPTYGTRGFYASVVFLCFNRKWSFVTACVVTLLYMILSYRELFDANIINENTFVMPIYFMLLMLNLIDITSSTLHFYSPEIRSREVYHRNFIGLLIVDFCSILATFVDAIVFLTRPGNGIITKIILAVAILRLHRHIDYFLSTTRSPLRQGLIHVFMKYALLFFTLNHTVACIWKMIACFNCKDGRKHWNDYISFTQTPFILYIMCLYNALDSTTAIGIVGGSPRNNAEFTLTLILMFYSILINTGVYLGAFTAVQVDVNQRRALFGTKLNLIEEKLEYDKITEPLKKKINTWYVKFWTEEAAVVSCPMKRLLPIGYLRDIKLDKYFNALNQSHLFRNLHDEVKTSLAMKMYTTCYNEGSIILHQNKAPNGMLFVGKGNVQLVSPDDIESPIITFEFGTSIASMSIVYPTRIPAHLIATTYCHIYNLSKVECWRVLAEYYKLKPSGPIFDAVKFIMHSAHVKHRDKLASRKKKDKTLKIVKNILKQRATTEITEKVNESNLLSIYHISKGEKVLRHMDSVFVTSTFPWILYPDSHFCITWDRIMLVLGMIVVIFYPYYVIYLETPPPIYSQFIRPVVYVMFIVDIIIQLFTSVVDDQKQVISSFWEIVTYRLGQIMFLLDLLSIFPFEIMNALTGKNHYYFASNHMLKLIRVVNRLIAIMFSLKFGGKPVRILFYLICLLYFGYLQGILYFKSGCPEWPCRSQSWVKRYINYVAYFKPKTNENNESLLLVSINVGLMLLTGAGGKLMTGLLEEKIAMLVFFLTYIYLYTYLLADYSATLTLDGFLTDQFMTDVNNMREFMLLAEMDKITVHRMNVYMETIYKLTDGKVMPDLWDDLPLPLIEKLNVNKLQKYLDDIPVFREFSWKMFRILLGKVKYETYPPDEYVVYSGDRMYNMIVIQEGFCEISRPGLHIKTILGPGDNVGIFEMLFSLPMCYNIKTVTNVNIFYINSTDFRNVLHLHPELEKHFNHIIQTTRNTMAVIRTFNVSNAQRQKDPVEMHTTESNFVKFKAGKLDPRTIDWKKGWSGYTFLSMFLLKKTIRPDSRFLYGYVIFHSVVAFYVSIVHPALFILESTVSWTGILLLSLPWDFLCLVDVYLRLHVCYYNKNGLLVSHPRFTATYYLKNSFAVDFITALPLKLLLGSFLQDYLTAVVLFVKVIRAYRIPNAFAYFRRDILKNPQTSVYIIHYLTISLVLWNALTLGFVLLVVDLHRNDDGTLAIIPKEVSWVYTKLNSEITFKQNEYSHPFKLYLLSLYYITTCSLQLTFGDIIMIQPSELIFSIVTLSLGYIWFNYILVIISNTKAVLNDNLTKYKNDLHDFNLFMKALHIPKSVQKRNIRHFEYIYSRNQGYRGRAVFDQFHPSLKMDCQLEMYLPTLLTIPIFKTIEFNFFQRLSAELNVTYFVENNNIISTNDVVNWMYIINRGYVQVYGPCASKLQTLTRGAMFGNLDNVEYARSMVQITTISTTDVLCIPTTKFYNLLQDYPTVMSSIKTELYVNNLCFIPSDEIIEATKMAEKLITLSKMDRILMSNWIKFVYMSISYISYQIVIYHLAFLDHSRFIFGITYLLDFLHVVKIYLVFHTPFMSSLGEFVSSSEAIRKRYLRKAHLYIDLVALIPFEMLSLAMPIGSISKFSYISMFRANRLLRFYNMSWYIKATHNYLNTNEIIIKVISICIYLTTYLHFIACAWYITACPNGVCLKDSWIYDGVTNKSNCDKEYLCSLYHATSLISCTGYSTFLPRKIFEIVFCILTIVISRFVTTLLVANMAAVVRHFGYRLQTISADVGVLKTYFKNAQLSTLLQLNILKYIERLWFRCNGNHMPYFLEIGPSLLIEEIKVFSFGTHIFENYVFQDCHGDFLRLLTTHTKLVRYFLDDVICKQGEVNDTMYFIHSGQVEVLCVSDKLEVQVDLLTTLDCFGMIQGLFPHTPHSHTYQAKGTADIVTLHLNDWIQLLVFYPAAKYHMYKMIRDYETLYRFNNRRTTRIVSY